MKGKMVLIGTIVLALVFGLFFTTCDDPPAKDETTYTVSFNSNGGSGTVPPQEALAGTSITLPSGSGLSRSGYTFGGWNTNAAGTGTNYNAGASYTVTDNVTLYAKWNSGGTTYTVTFNANGGSGTAPTAQTANSGSSITLPSGSGLSRTDYTFGGWNTNAAGTGTNYNAGASYTVTGNVTLYAKWNAASSETTNITLNYNEYGEESSYWQTTVGIDSFLNGSKITAGDEYILTYSFMSNIAIDRLQVVLVDTSPAASYWNALSDYLSVQSNISANTVVSGSIIFTATATATDTTGIANCIAIQAGSGTASAPTLTFTTLTFERKTDETTIYTVTFDANGGSGSEYTPSMTANSGSSITLPSGSGLTRTGYTFGGWNTNSSGTGTNYNVGASYTVTGDVTLYAKWNSGSGGTTYTVTFDSNGGGAVESQTVLMNNTATTPDNPIKEGGYTFAGWYSDSELTTEYNFSTQVTGNITLYAKWIPFYVVTFNSNEGSAMQNQAVTSGGTATRPADPTKSGYSFENWYSDSALTTVYNFSTAVTGNITLYAKWIPIYTVTFNSNSGSSVQAQSVNSGGTATRPENPTRSGYTFENWYSDSALTTVYNFSTAVTGSITLYAKWYPQGSAVITIGFIPDAAPVITGPTIYISGDDEDTPSSATITLENPARYNSINWYIPGTGINASGASITLSAENTAYNTPGEHALTVEVKINGIPYGRTIIFTVAEVEEEEEEEEEGGE